MLTGVRIIIIIWPLYQHGYILHAFYGLCILCIHNVHTNYGIINVDKQLHNSLDRYGRVQLIIILKYAKIEQRF